MKAMKISRLITTLVMGTAVLSAQETARQTATISAEEAAFESAQFSQIISDYTRAIKSVCELMEQVQDAESAAALAPRIQARRSVSDELSFGIMYAPKEKVEASLTAAGVTEERFVNNLNRLEQNRFYGCAALAESLGYPPSALYERAEITPAILEQVGRDLVKALEGQLPAGISGGPGLTEKTAWKLGQDPQNLNYVSVIMETLPGAEREDQKLVRTQEGPIYGRMSYLLPVDGKVYSMEMWFDVTEIIRAQDAEDAAMANAEEAETYDEDDDTPEEEAADEETNEPEETPVVIEETADEPMVDLPQPEVPTLYSDEVKKQTVDTFVKETYNCYLCLKKVTDRASADAAAEPLKLYFNTIESIANILQQVSLMDVLEGMEAIPFTPDSLQNEMQRLEKADFYGSETLKEVFSAN